MNCAKSHKEYFAALADLEDDRLKIYSDEAATSIERQKQIEAGDQVGFDEYLQQYFSDQGFCD